MDKTVDLLLALGRFLYNLVVCLLKLKFGKLVLTKKPIQRDRNSSAIDEASNATNLNFVFAPKHRDKHHFRWYLKPHPRPVRVLSHSMPNCFVNMPPRLTDCTEWNEPRVGAAAVQENNSAYFIQRYAFLRIQ